MKNIKDFKIEVEKYFRDRGWSNSTLFRSRGNDIVIYQSFFVGYRHSNGKVIKDWTPQHTQWLLEHLQPFLTKYYIKKEDIRIL